MRTLPKFDKTLLLDFNNQRLKRVLSTFDERGVTKVYSGADPQIDLNMDLSNTDQTGCGFEFGLWVWILISQMKVWICRNQVWIQISGFGSVNLGLCGIAVSWKSPFSAHFLASQCYSCSMAMKSERTLFIFHDSLVKK